MVRISTSLAAALLLAATASAQITWTVPPKVPQGCWVPISVSNDTPNLHEVGECSPFQVRQAGGGKVFDQPCWPLVAIKVPPGEAVSFYWDQLDNLQNPVPPGDYVVIADADPFTLHPLTIGGEATVAPMGAMRLGTSRNVQLCSPGDPNLLYLLAASLSDSPGIPACGTTLPLFPDLLFVSSLDPANGFPSAGFGTLDAQGVNRDPSFTFPNNPNFAGVEFFTAFEAIDLTQSCPFVRASEALSITILP